MNCVPSIDFLYEVHVVACAWAVVSSIAWACPWALGWSMLSPLQSSSAADESSNNIA